MATAATAATASLQSRPRHKGQIEEEPEIFAFLSGELSFSSRGSAATKLQQEHQVFAPKKRIKISRLK